MLYSSKWEARVAAASCLRLIAQHVQHHGASELELASVTGTATRAASDGARLSLQRFDLTRVVQEGAVLLQSGGQVSSLAS